WTATWPSCLSCSAICSACSRISASRGSSGSGTSVTAGNHPAARRPPPGKHEGGRRNVTTDHPAQFKGRSLNAYVSRSGFYDWKSRPEPETAKRRELLKIKVKALFDANN